MWIVSTAGIFSAVRNLRRAGTVMVRARRRQDLEGLRKRFKLTGRVLDTPSADYPHRLVLATKTWRRIAASLADDCERYHNFKSAVEAREGRTSARADALHEIWGVLRELEDLEAGRRVAPPRWRRAKPAAGDDEGPNPHGWGEAANVRGTVRGFVPRMTGPTIAAGGQDDE
jgi:hypothetical protein